MITFKAVVLKKHKKADGTWNVKIRVTYDRRSSYLPTNAFVKKDQLNSKQTQIKDISVKKKFEPTIDNYRKIVEDLRITSSLSVSDVVTFIERQLKKQEKKEIDFIAFINERINQLRAKHGKDHKTATGYNTVVNSLQDFFKSEKVLITDINPKSLQAYEEYLKTERKVMRKDRKGELQSRTLKPVGNGIHNYMKDIRALFRDAIDEFNDEDEGESKIKHYPFKKYKVPKPGLTPKRNVKVEVIKSIRDFELKKAPKQNLLQKRNVKVQVIGNTSEDEANERKDLIILGKEVFLLSFFLVGINLIDIFEVEQVIEGRLTYNRSKTESRRDDKALISIKVEPEAVPLISKYADPDCQRVFNFYHRYSTINNFTKAVNKGLKQLSEELKLQKNLTSGYARASWATIAHNICKISKDDVDLALNHVDPRHKLADIYIEKDFSMIDESNRKVLDTLR